MEMIIYTTNGNTIKQIENHSDIQNRAAIEKKKNHTNQCCQWKIVKEIRKDLPNIGISIPVNKIKNNTSVQTCRKI